METEAMPSISAELQQDAEKVTTTEKVSVKSHIKGVSFMIKAKEEETPMLQMTALPYESSDEDEEENGEESDSSEANVAPAKASASAAAIAQSSVGATASKRMMPSSAENTQTSVFDTALSLQSDSKKNDHRLADRLAAAAREKMARANREKHLQEQRKRKAAAFLTLLKKSDTVPSDSEPADVDTFSTSGAAADIPSSPLPVPTARSRSSTPAVVIQVPSPAASSSPFVEKSLGSRSCIPSVMPSLTATTKPETTRCHRHRSKSPRRHRHRSRSRSPHRKRSRSPSRKHRKRDKKIAKCLCSQKKISITFAETEDCRRTISIS